MARAKPASPTVGPARKRAEPAPRGTAATSRGSASGASKKTQKPRTAEAKAKPASAPMARPEMKLERGRFTLPAKDFQRIAALKARARDLGRRTRKNELFRVGLTLMTALSDESLVIALDQLEPVGKKARKRTKSDLDNRDG